MNLMNWHTYILKKDVVHYINVDHIESLDIEEVTEGQHITYDFE